jgi:DNA-binding MarR family transcriptional regulator
MQETERDAVDAILEQWRRERPDLDPSAMGIVGRISRAALLLEPELARAFAAHGLAGSEFDVLATLRRSGKPYRLTPGELARSTMVTTGGMTKRLDRLEARGLARRLPDPRDRRGSLVELTADGLAAVDAALTAHLANEERLLAALSRAEREQLAAFLRKLMLSLEGPAGPEPSRPAL